MPYRCDNDDERPLTQDNTDSSRGSESAWTTMRTTTTDGVANLCMHETWMTDGIENKFVSHLQWGARVKGDEGDQHMCDADG